MKKLSLILSTLFIALNFLFVNASILQACTQFQIKTTDGIPVIGRSMEFSLDLDSAMVVHPRGENKQSTAPGGSPGLKWVSQYGYVNANAMGVDTVADGINEKGLSLGALWMPQVTEYQSVTWLEKNRALSIVDFGSWVLGNFSNVEEIREAVKGVKIWGEKMPQLQNTVPPLHYAITDASGNAIVIEFIKGQVKIYDNPLGTLTNYPPFEWQLINLQNYINLSAVNVGAVKFHDTVLAPTGEGSGLLGIPGDWTPPSRFVRATTFKHFAKKAANAGEGVNLANHILNTVDIPIGDVRESKTVDKGDYTQWVVIKDLKNRIMYFRTYKNLNLRAIHLTDLDFSPGAPKKSIPMAGGDGIQNITAQLKAKPSPQKAPAQESTK